MTRLPRLAWAITGLAAALLLGPAPGALAETETFNSTGGVHVSNDNEPEGDAIAIAVPPGRATVDSVQVSVSIDWGTSAQELSLQLESPGGSSLLLFTEGCFEYEPADIWTFSDAAAQLSPNDKNDPKCDLPGGTFRPTDIFPTFKKMSIFNGGPTSGTWTLRAFDNFSTGFTNQGDIASWALRIDHAAAPAAAQPPVAAKKKCKKGRKLRKGKCVRKRRKK